MVLEFSCNSSEVIQECFLCDKMRINDKDKEVMWNHAARIPH